MIPEHMSHLPVYAGRPVPWVACWSAEQHGPLVRRTPHGLTIVGNELYASREGDMWFITTPTDRNGTPNFGETNSARQRNCMRTQRCQVCGRLPAETGKAPYWTAPQGENQHQAMADEGYFLNPPTCPACFLAAHEFCPHLKQYKVPVYLGEPKVREIVGDFFAEDGAIHRVRVPLGHPANRFVIGRELIVKLRHQLRIEVER